MATIKIPVAQAPPIPNINVAVLGPTCTEQQRRELVVLMLSSFHGLSADPNIAVSKMLTILFSCIPETMTYLSTNGANISLVVMPYTTLVEDMAKGTPPQGMDKTDWALDSIDLSCLTVTDASAIYASAAVAWMTYAKSAGESARTALEEARPKMMRGKYLLDDADAALFPGEAWGPTIEGLDQTNLGMTLNPRIRYLITAFFISLRNKSVFVPPHMDPFMLVFDMLKNTGMTHVGAITKFVKMCPWALKVPELASDFSAFAAELMKMSQVAVDLRPYHRLLVPQSDFLFIASTFKPLVAVAGSYIQEVDVSFRNYVYNAAQYADLIARVRARAPQDSKIPDVRSLEALFGVIATDPAPPPDPSNLVNQSMLV